MRTEEEAGGELGHRREGGRRPVLLCSSSVEISVVISVCLSVYLSIHPSIHLFIHPSIYPTLSIHQSFYHLSCRSLSLSRSSTRSLSPTAPPLPPFAVSKPRLAAVAPVQKRPVGQARQPSAVASPMPRQ